MKNDGKSHRRFSNPLDIQPPIGAEDWSHMYPYYLLFSEEKRVWEQERFWFQEKLHFPEVLFPFDTIIAEAIRVSLSQNNSRIFAVPQAYGLEQRLLNGYLYFSPVAVLDSSKIETRTEIFVKRATFYYDSWDERFENWKSKVSALVSNLKNIEIPPLRNIETEDSLHHHPGISSGHLVLEAYNETISNLFTAWQYHFEMLNLGYIAYLNLFHFCKQMFPGIGEEAISRLVTGNKFILFRPDEELKKLASLAIELKVHTIILNNMHLEGAIDTLIQSENGRKWLGAFENAKDPWFYYSIGTGFYHHHRSWIDDLEVPWRAVRRYIESAGKSRNAEDLFAEHIRRRNDLMDEYASFINSPNDREAFHRNVNLARKVASYIEDHNFYIEHWHHTLFWNKVRQFGERLAESGFISDKEDIFLLNRWEVGQALYELVARWATGGEVRGGEYWLPVIKKRRSIITALQSWSPPPALGISPVEVSEPFTLMLYGINSELVKMWHNHPDQGAELKGVPASPGVASGIARVIRNVSELNNVQPGEILVCPSTSPSWGTILGIVNATISDIGGIMSHAAIVCREYGVPAVVGTGNATTRIQTGDNIRVDGSTGIVTILDSKEQN